MSDIPQNAYVLPDEKTSYIAVWQNETRLVIRLLNFGASDEFDIKLDRKIIPHLVDALIELQNQ
jgi:hypothetical protein